MPLLLRLVALKLVATALPIRHFSTEPFGRAENEGVNVSPSRSALAYR
ncbi:hypothetical protein ADUPG1_004732, partial [Aduncisulcus paluster]